MLVFSFQTFLLLIAGVNLTSAKIHKLRGSTAVFTCQFTGPTVAWSYRPSTSGGWTVYTSNGDIANIPQKSRLSITGEFSAGEYNLNIRDLVDKDKGYYRCVLKNGVTVVMRELVVIVGPNNVQISRKTPDNKINGTEGHPLLLQCAATGGSLAPDVKLLINGYKVNTSKQSVTYTIQTLNRSQDGENITCLAGYISMNDFPLQDSARLHLSLKPFAPTFNPLSISVIEGDSIEVMCTSTGSRPAAVFNWNIHGANITDNSEITSSILDQSTYAVISKLSYTLAKDHNGQNLTCKAINIAAPNGVPAIPITVDVKYPPFVTVKDKTITERTSPVVLSCNADGNPDVYTFYDWTHESLHGTLIRRLSSNNSRSLTLPHTNETIRYQNTGRYNCTVGNGIPDTATRKSGSGVLNIEAPPVFALYNSWTQGGEIRRESNISAFVYSDPTPLNLVWHRGDTQVSASGYKTFLTQSTVTVMFHGKEVKVNGFMVILTINEVKDSDFTTYRLVVSNTRGSNGQNIVFNSISAPDPPGNLSVIGQTDQSITVQWEAGYDGGYEQVFYISYKQQGTESWTTITGPKGVRVSNHVYKTEIKRLQPSTKYEIKMFAENQINKSAESMVEIGVTETKSNGGSSGAVIGGVVGGLSFAVIILIVVVVIMKLRKRSDGSGKNKILRSDFDSDGEDGLKDNILYKSVDTGSSKPPEAPPSEYAEPIDMYAEVSKPKQQKDTKEKKQKGKKSPGNRKQKPIAVNNNSADVCTNQSEYGNVGNPTGGYKNADGLQYADITFINPPKTKPGKAGKPVIHGLDDRTIYCDVDHTKKAPPLPQEGAYELTDIGKGNQT